MKTSGAISRRGGRAPVPELPDHHEAHDAVGHHGGGDGDAVGRGEPARGAEQADQQQYADQQHDVDARQIDLPGMALGGVAHLEARQEPELDGLAHQREGAGDDGLARDHGRRGGEPDQRHQHAIRHHAVERIFDRVRMRQHQRALPEIVDEQARQHEEEPRGLDRLAAEMAEIGVERLAAGDRQEHCAEDHQPDHAVGQQEADAVPRVHRRQHRRIVADVHQPHHAQGEKPDDHDRAESAGHQRRAAALHREQADQDHQRERHDIVFERRGRDLEAFDRREHRDRRRDHGVAEEHGGADHAQSQQQRRPPAERALAERHQRQRAALAVVVGAQQQQHVFDGDDDDQRPQDQRQHAEHDLARHRPAMGGVVDGLAEGVERRGADVAEHHADAAESKRPKSGRDRHLAGCIGRCFAGSHDRRNALTVSLIPARSGDHFGLAFL